MEADNFIVSILHGFPGARAEVVTNALSAAPRGTSRPTLDSWENYMERHVIWIDAGPSPVQDPGAVVQWFSFVPRSPTLGLQYTSTF